MDFHKVVRTRRSVRSYKIDHIPDEVVDRVLEAVRVAPSGSNRQPWYWVLVKEEEKKKRLAKICNSQMWIAEAPVVIVACGRNLNFNRAGYMGDMSVLVDTSIAFTHLILAARNEGLGTCWIGAFDNEKVKRLLNVPENWYVVAITPMGYPKEGEKAFRGPSGRKAKEEIISTDKF